MSPTLEAVAWWLGILAVFTAYTLFLLWVVDWAIRKWIGADLETMVAQWLEAVAENLRRRTK